MGCGIVQAEQRLEVFQCLLGYSSAHLLGLIQNDDGPVGSNHINGPAGCKFIPLGIDDAGFLALAVLFQGRCKSLGVDDHDLNAGTGGEVVQLIQILAVVDEEPGLLPVILHEMVSHDLKTLFHALPDGNGGHHYNELTPAIGFVQLKNCFDVNIGFAGAGLHLNIQAAPAQTFHKARGQFDIVLTLYLVDILQQLFVGQVKFLVFVAGIIVRVYLCRPFHFGLLHVRDDPFAQVPDVANPVMEPLSGKHLDHCIHSIGLVLLDFKVEFQCQDIPSYVSHKNVANVILHPTANLACLTSNSVKDALFPWPLP